MKNDQDILKQLEEKLGHLIPSLIKFDRSIRDGVLYDEAKGIVSLSLVWNHLSESWAILEYLGQLQKLHYLNLKFNQLQKIPKSFGRLNLLQFFDLSGNHLEELPESFGQLQSLKELDLSNNRLWELPKSFGHLNSLQILNLSGNELQYLP